MINMKDAILDATDGGRKIFELLYGNAAAECFQKNGKGHFKLREDERTASASFKKIKSSSGTDYWILHDFGADTTINAIDAYMAEEGIQSFRETLYILANKFNVNYFLNPDVNKQKVKFEEKKKDDKEGTTTWKTREITDDELSIMGATVTREAMAKYKYYALESYRHVGPQKVAINESTPDYPIFLHDCGNFQKIYKPLEFDKAKRFFYIGKKPMNYINGLEEAEKELKDRIEAYNDYIDEGFKHDKACEQAGLTDDKKLPEIIICSGERDAMCMAGLGYMPVWFNSETAKKTNDELNKLFSLASKVYNVPDRDDTGIAMGRTLALDHMAIHTIELPEWLANHKDARQRPCKDLRDYIDIRPGKDEFQKLLYSAQCAKFWEITHEKGRTKVEIKALSLLYFLKLNGFRKYKDPLTKEIKYIRIEGYVVTEYDPILIRDFVRRTLQEQQVGNTVLEAYLNSKKTGKQIYDDLETVDIDFANSDIHSRTFFFKNVCVRVHAPNPNDPNDTSIEIFNKPRDNKYVWAHKIIPHNFTRLEPSFKFDFDQYMLIPQLENNPSKVMRYLINASRLYWREEYEKHTSDNPDVEKAHEENMAYMKEHMFDLYGPRLIPMEQDPEKPVQARALQAQCFLNKIYTNGYLLHHHKLPYNSKAVWAMEWRNEEEGSSNGRSGKSLMFSCLKKTGLCEMVTMQGRNRKLTDNNHFMESVDNSTDILLIDDARKGFDFDTFYTMITGSVTINPKNEKQYELSYEDAPNIVFTSNFPIPNTDSSTLDRMLFVAFSDYYHAMGEDTNFKEDRKVSDELGTLFDDNYGEDLYNADINFYIDCLIFYLQCINKGIKAIQPPTDSIIMRAKRGQVGEPMYKWAVQFFDPESGHLNVCLIKQAVYEDYSKSIKRGEELKGSNAFMKGLRAFVKIAEHIEEMNPETHPYMHSDGRMSGKATYNNKTQAWELVYMRTTDSAELSKTIETNI